MMFSINGTQHIRHSLFKKLSITKLSNCHYSECRILSIGLHNVFMLSIIMLDDVILTGVAALHFVKSFLKQFWPKKANVIRVDETSTGGNTFGQT